MVVFGLNFMPVGSGFQPLFLGVFCGLCGELLCFFFDQIGRFSGGPPEAEHLKPYPRPDGINARISLYS
jgi:hypothetical protein